MSRIINTKLWLCLLCLLSGHVSAQTLEYWFDDHYDQSATTSIATSDAEQTLYLDLRDNNKFPIGFHKLNMRIIIDGKASAVYSSGVLKLTAGNVSELEYWVDDNGHKKTLGVKGLNDDGAYLFLDSLDLSDVAPGYHKLYYRAVSNSKRTTSAVSSTPIMVKSKYNVEDTEALKVTEQAYWIDDEDPEIISVARPKNVINQPYAIDIRKLSDGKHTLHLQYANSAGIWNGPVSKTFTKIKVDEPKIEATASVDNGIVTMKFNSVPYGYVYSLIRQYPSGTKRNVENINNSEYPATLQATDEPALGKYVYYVEGRYTDADGKIQKVCSNEINLNIENVSDKVKRGNIHGILKFNDRPMDYCSYSILINGKEYDHGYDTEISYTGTFKVKNIPYGTEVTIGIKANNYKFDAQTLIVNENTTNGKIFFDGTWIDGEIEEELPDNATNDLELVDKIRITANGWEIPICNLSSKTWTGNLIVKVISKAVKDYNDKLYTEEGLSIKDLLLKPDAFYKSDNFYTTIVDMPVNIQGKSKGWQIVLLDITDMPNAKKNEDYYVYVFSRKNEIGGTKMLKDSYGRLNPHVLEFNPFDYKKAAISVMDETVNVMKWVKKFADWGDPFKLAWKTLKDADNNFIDRYDPDADKNLPEDELNAYLRSAGLLMNCFFGEVHQVIMKAITKNEVYKASDKISDLYSSVKDAYNASQADDGHKFFALAREVLKYVDKGDPVVSLYKSYFEISEKMVDAINNMTKNVHDHDVWYKLYSGKGVYKIKVRKDTGPKGGLLYFSGSQFCEHNEGNRYITHDGQIESIIIKLIDPDNSSHNLTEQVKVENIELENDGIVIKNLKFPSTAAQPDKVDAWMTIVWKNKRVTHIPLLHNAFVKLENFNSINKDVPLTMTVELQSGSYYDEKSIPNHLTIVKPETSWFDF